MAILTSKRHASLVVINKYCQQILTRRFVSCIDIVGTIRDTQTWRALNFDQKPCVI